ncbi:MAG: aldolase [Candidatus Adiutrix sp.]|jgi:4-hydroxy-2-oxoheptanedioate aldolase|nr:aldolase [Candidatus Adiutrix sp.]
MDTNRLKKKFKDGQAAIGAFVRLNSVSMEVLGLTGWDFAIIDVEHGVHTMEDVSNMIRAARSVGLTSIVRTPGPEPVNIQRCLDAGAQGVQVPQLTSLKEVEDACRAARYYPLGNRGSCPFNASTGYSTVPFPEHMESSNREVMLALHVENVWAADNIDKILEMPGIDVIFCGPYDLSQSMGIPGQTEAPALMEKMKKVFAACRAKNVTSGVFASNPEKAGFWAEQGVQYLACSADVHFLAQSLKRAADAMRAQLAELNGEAPND